MTKAERDDTEYRLTDSAAVTVVRTAAQLGSLARVHPDYVVLVCDLADEADRLREVLREVVAHSGKNEGVCPIPGCPGEPRASIAHKYWCPYPDAIAAAEGSR